MIIDIDIKIANSDGKMIHRFSKRFDEKLEISDKINKGSGISKDFEDFLSEYLTSSGRSYREKLITYPDTSAFDQNSRDQTEGEGPVMEKDTTGGITDSEMEYKIFLGNNKVLTGKIPFERLNRLNRVADVINKADNENIEVPDTKGYLDQSDYTSTYPKNNLDYRSKEIVVDFERNLKNMMIQAVEKYESSFYHTGEEISLL